MVKRTIRLCASPAKRLEAASARSLRIWNREREFNNAAGFTSKDDSLPPRLLTEGCSSGPAQGKVNELAKMLPKYYEARGWDADGRPTSATRDRLGL